MAEQGRHDAARRLYVALGETPDPWLNTLVANDLSALSALDGDHDAALTALRGLLSAHPLCEPARLMCEPARLNGVLIPVDIDLGGGRVADSLHPENTTSD
jgi:hypothetical protein